MSPNAVDGQRGPKTPLDKLNRSSESVLYTEQNRRAGRRPRARLSLVEDGLIKLQKQISLLGRNERRFCSLPLFEKKNIPVAFPDASLR
jgi:hypothetical protein